MAGYSETPLPKKLGLKDGFRIAFVNSPKGFITQLGTLPVNVRVLTRPVEPIDFILLFADDEKSLAKRFQPLAKKLSRQGMIWIAWPKKSSGVPTDLSFECVQRIGLLSGLVDVKICAINEIWSGLKFVYRLKDR